MQIPTEFEVRPGTTDMAAVMEHGADVLLPGRGRAANGTALPEAGLARVELGASVYQWLGHIGLGGLIITTGYKTPAENNGELWRPDKKNLNGLVLADRDAGREYIGPPEGILMAHQLINRGISPADIRCECQSIDTTTNFVFTEQRGYFSDDRRPVIIVAQEGHLKRMLRYVAPKTLRRPYLGIAVPEPGEGEKDQDSIAASLFSRAALMGITPDTKNADGKVERRVKSLWSGVLVVRHISEELQRQATRLTGGALVADAI